MSRNADMTRRKRTNVTYLWFAETLNTNVLLCWDSISLFVPDLWFLSGFHPYFTFYLVYFLAFFHCKSSKERCAKKKQNDSHMGRFYSANNRVVLFLWLSFLHTLFDNLVVLRVLVQSQDCILKFVQLAHNSQTDLLKEQFTHTWKFSHYVDVK